MSDVPSTFRLKTDVHGFGEVSVNGHALQSHVRSVNLSTFPDELPKITLDVLALGGLDVELPADIELRVEVLEPGILEVERSDDGKTQRIRFIREGP